MVKPSKKLKDRRTGRVLRKKVKISVSATSYLDPTRVDVTRVLVKTK